MFHTLRRSHRRPAARTSAFRPVVRSLEDRKLLTIDLLAFGAISPGGLKTGVVELNGTIRDSSGSPISTNGLTASFEIDDAAGHVLASGALPLSQSDPTSDKAAFSLNLPPSVAAGQVETVKITATDADESVTRLVGLTISPTQGVSAHTVSAKHNHHKPVAKPTSNAGFALYDPGVADIAGTAKGQLSVNSTPTSLAASGSGKFQLGGTLASASNQITASAAGSFALSYDSTGQIHLKIKGSAAVRDTLPGTLDIALSATNSFIKFDRTPANAITLSAGVNTKADVTVGANHIVGKIRKGSLKLTSDGAGHFHINASGTTSLVADGSI